MGEIPLELIAEKLLRQRNLEYVMEGLTTEHIIYAGRLTYDEIKHYATLGLFHIYMDVTGKSKAYTPKNG